MFEANCKVTEAEFLVSKFGVRSESDSRLTASRKVTSSMCLLFFHLASLQNCTAMMS